MRVLFCFSAISGKLRISISFIGISLTAFMILTLRGFEEDCLDEPLGAPAGPFEYCSPCRVERLGPPGPRARESRLVIFFVSLDLFELIQRAEQEQSKENLIGLLG